MCGRYSITTPVEALRRLFCLAGPAPNLAARYNVAPCQDVPVVRAAGDGARSLAMLRWGLVPSWAKDAGIGNRLINARLETVHEKPSFRAAAVARRCILPADGFYEWKKEGKAKQPYRICLEDGAPFGFAGLWERWRDPAGSVMETCAILTTEANEALRAIHHRMPVILDPAGYAAWLDPGETDAVAALSLPRPIAARRLVAYPVSRYVNAARNDDPACIEPRGETPSLF
jgi:putative SOS response-associated peptidase YedK